jgi:hypothetical protein
MIDWYVYIQAAMIIGFYRKWAPAVSWWQTAYQMLDFFRD